MRGTRLAPQNIKRGRGGYRRGSGRPQRRPLPWPAQFDLKTKENADAFLVYYIRAFWDQNPLDARAGGCLNNALRLLFEVQGWIQKAPLQIVQAQVAPPPRFISEAELQRWNSRLRNGISSGRSSNSGEFDNGLMRATARANLDAFTEYLGYDNAKFSFPHSSARSPTH